jgi:hypothetical protein
MDTPIVLISAVTFGAFFLLKGYSETLSMSIPNRPVKMMLNRKLIKKFNFRDVKNMRVRKAPTIYTDPWEKFTSSRIPNTIE